MKKLFLVCIVLLLISAEAFSQCSMCGAVVSSNLESEANNIGKSLNTGILYLMALPYILIGTIAFIFFRKQIREKIKSLR